MILNKLVPVAMFGSLLGTVSSCQEDLHLSQMDEQAAAAEELVLASFELPNGNYIQFLGNPVTEEHGLQEMVQGGNSPTFDASLNASTLERFLLLTPEDVPVPRLLIETETKDEVREKAQRRAVVDTLDAMELQELHTPRTHNPTLWNCGADTSTNFASDFCHSSGGSNVLEYCDSGVWTSLIRQATRERIFSVTAFCEDDDDEWTGAIKHFTYLYNTCSSFSWDWCNLGVNQLNICNNCYWWADYGGSSKDRRAHHFRLTYGHVRGYTVLYNQ